MGECDILNTEVKKEVRNMQYVGKIDKGIYQTVVNGEMITDEVIITDNRVQHIIERRGQAFYDEYKEYFNDIVTDPDYIFKDKADNTVVVSKTFIHKGTAVNLVLRLVVEGENPEYKNSIITAIKENDKRFRQRLRNKTPVYKKVDK